MEKRQDIHPALENAKAGAYSAELIADSISSTGKRIQTFALVYPRMVHAELMTHRVFSRNAMSSRAIPVSKLIELVNETPAMPVYWGKNQSGMQAKEENTDLVNIDLNWLVEGLQYDLTREEAWLEGLNFATTIAKGFAGAGYHKQIANRGLETYQYIRTIVTSTEWDNWYWLRDHKDAQPEIQVLASMMWESQKNSDPKELTHEEWHTPFYENGVWSEVFGGVDVHGHTLEEALKISSSCCAQSSFRKEDRTLEKAEFIWDKLVNSVPVHASPFEHQAKPMRIHTGRTIDAKYDEGTTHIDLSGRVWSANFCQWVQHRQLIPGNVCNNYQP